MTALLNNTLQRGVPTEINTEEPNVMHVDLNSCFATIEQQAQPRLRGRPIGVTNRISPHCCMIALSYEAKSYGAKVGMRFDEAKRMIPDLIVLETDPPKYHHAYKTLMSIMKSYSPKVMMKSIDEGIIDFHGTRKGINTKPLEDVGYEIKKRLKDELGCWMKCNIGISTNRFLAKLAAGRNKPDGLTLFDHNNLESIYKKLVLTDLPGIATRFEKRLNQRGIITPTDFLNAPLRTLHTSVFQSVVGVYWYQRLRGYEVDDVETKLGNVGKQFVLDIKTQDEHELKRRFAYLCYTTARKLRYNNVKARGLYLFLTFQDKNRQSRFHEEESAYRHYGLSWYKRHLFTHPFSSDQSVYENALLLFNQRPKNHTLTSISITCYHLHKNTDTQQLELFGDIINQEKNTETMDEINDLYGMPTITLMPALGSHSIVKQKIPFGGTQYFDLLLKGA